MKNLHVIPTEKSRLYIHQGKLYDNSRTMHIPDGTQIPQHIYITSDEPIKEGDYGLIGKDIGKIIISGDGYEFLMGVAISYEYADFYYLQEVCKKIILTTDQDLIKDGVQAIDDEFLEWFVENPSCEFVEVIYEPKNFLDTKQGWEYEIIIPQEEPKQDKIMERFISNAKQEETLEEAAERKFQNIGDRLIFEDGAKWKEEQDKNKYSDEKEFYKYMAKQDSWKSVGLIIQEFIQLKLKEQDKKLYSEEDMNNYAEYCTSHVLKSQIGHPYLSVKEWFRTI
jgi:hypothetical protein